MKPIPQHRQIYDALRERIARGEYVSGAKLPPESRLTQEFGVSRITVMRALRDLQNDGFIWRKQGAGSFVRNLEGGHLRLGVMIPGLVPATDQSIFPTVQHHLLRHASKLGWQALLGSTEIPLQVDAAGCAPVEVARRLVLHGAKGVVFTPLAIDGDWNALNRNALAEFKAAGVAVVLLARDIVEYPQRSEWDVVGMDDINAGYLVGKHLANEGCHRVAFVRGPEQMPQLRLLGLRQALAEVEIPLADDLVWREAPDDVRLVREVRRRRYDGIVCDNDIHAALVMHNLLAAGIKIPQQVRLVSFDDSPAARMLPIPLTSFAQPAEGLALSAISALLGRMREPSLPPRFIQLEGRLMVRKSSHL